MEPTEAVRKGNEESEVPAAVAAASFAELVDRASVRGDRIVVTGYGKRRAAIIGMEDFERLRALDAA